MDIDEDDEIELAAAMDVDAAGGEDAEPYMVDLFPFAKPIKYYENMLSTVCHCETAPFLVLLSRSAHPCAVIGGRPKGLEVIAYYGGVQAHNFNHGQALLESILTMRSWSRAKATTSVAIKRCRLFRRRHHHQKNSAFASWRLQAMWHCRHGGLARICLCRICH